MSNKEDIFADTDIEALRKDMLRFAHLQLRDESIAEDAVQEALIAAHSAKARFEGRAQLKTWVFSILKNKIIDILRERVRKPTESLTQEDGSDELFDENGNWRKESQPSDWGQPELAFKNEQFLEVLQFCLDSMKENVARVFMMREFLGLSTAEICIDLEISESNCWVILHRARSNLRVCLEKKWI